MNGSIDAYYVKNPKTADQRPAKGAPADTPYIRYRIRWYGPPDPVTGKRNRQRGGFYPRTEAEKALRQELVAIDEGRNVDPSKVALGQWVEEYLESVKPVGAKAVRGRLAPTTYENYSRYLRAWVRPYPIASVALADLEAHHFDALYDALATRGGRSSQGLAGKSILNVHNMLSGALNAAVRQRRLITNPMAGIQHKPRAERPDLTWWTPEQLRTFIDHVRDDRLFAAWALFSTTGMRRSEVAGLSWRDIDLDGGVLTVRQALVPVNNQPVLKAYPKSDASARKLALDPFTIAALRARRSSGLQERVALGPAYDTAPVDDVGTVMKDLVFTWPEGRAINPKSWSRWFKKHARRASLPDIRLHDVRHTYASAVLANAPDWGHVLALSKRLGHSSIGLTLDTYSHVLPSVDQQMVNSMAELIMGDTA